MTGPPRDAASRPQSRRRTTARRAQGRRDTGAASGHDVLARLGLQRLNLVDKGALQHCGVLPSRVLQRAGNDVLRHAVEVVGDARRVVCLQRPVPAHLLERHPPEQQRIGGVALLAKGRLNVCVIDRGVIAGRIEPTLRRLDDAVERDVLSDDQVPQISPPGDDGLVFPVVQTAPCDETHRPFPHRAGPAGLRTIG
jgi:hypothetical protein